MVDCDLQHLPTEADDRNLAGGGLLERLGFRCEARLVEADWFKGEWSTRVYAMLNREWHGREITAKGGDEDRRLPCAN